MKICIKCGRTLPDEEFPFHSKGKPNRRNQCRECKQAYNKRYYEENKEHFQEYRRQYEANLTPEELEVRRKRQHDYYMIYYPKNKEHVLSQSKIYRDKHKKEIRAWIQDWERRNPERAAERNRRSRQTQKWKDYQKQWRKENIEKVRETQRDSKRRYRAEHPEESREYERQYSKREKARLTDKAGNHKRLAREKGAVGEFTREDIETQYSKQQGKCFWCSVDISTKYHIDHYIPLSRGGTNWPDNIVLTCPSCNLRRHNRMPDESFEYLANHPANSKC